MSWRRIAYCEPLGKEVDVLERYEECIPVYRAIRCSIFKARSAYAPTFHQISIASNDHFRAVTGGRPASLYTIP